MHLKLSREVYNSGEVHAVYIASLLVSLTENFVIENSFEIGDLTSQIGPVTCPTIKSFDRTKGKSLHVCNNYEYMAKYCCLV